MHLKITVAFENVDQWIRILFIQFDQSECAFTVIFNSHPFKRTNQNTWTGLFNCSRKLSCWIYDCEVTFRDHYKFQHKGHEKNKNGFP